MTGQQRPAVRAPARLALRLAGAGLLVAAGAIHLDLYLTGYRSIPVIGWLFLLQVIAAFGLGAAVLATGGWLAAAAGAGFALATLGGYLLSLWIGLFGFTEVRTTAGIIAGIIDVAAFAALTALAALTGLTAAPGGRGQAAPGRTGRQAPGGAGAHPRACGPGRRAPRWWRSWWPPCPWRRWRYWPLPSRPLTARAPPPRQAA